MWAKWWMSEFSFSVYLLTRNNHQKIHGEPHSVYKKIYATSTFPHPFEPGWVILFSSSSSNSSSTFH
ncbi:hypothetical protein PHYPO_G00244690 [Pangasianodon hypophthalmus]|uniref:Uncharacterized protein n=1 Tax=Pangasianodon hypophthalmus TaxID=310915 RepID=A0A5N5NDJ7_PANHP|nr:hypothetical protein PHYPO_G00244690 [Pangasianodon hypophthalmus]